MAVPGPGVDSGRASAGHALRTRWHGYLAPCDR